MKKGYFKINFVFALLLFTTSLFAQKQITGKVTADNNEPLPGVSIVVKGTANGTTTDFDGNYSISNVSNNATLIFSYISFVTKEVVVNNQTEINVSLEEKITNLNEVMVVGYGTKKKSEVISSVAQVSGDIVKKNQSANFTTSLAGRLPGLVINQTTAEPGRENVNILIRGRGTFRDNTVLVVIDGIPGRDGLDRLDPQDIESVSVLKDASASIYGARAANGVILITTKRGEIGKPQFSFTSNYSITAPTRFVKNANAYDYARQINEVQTRTGATPIYSANDLANFQSPNFATTDWWREVYDRQSAQKRYNLSLRGGTEKARYFLSLGTTQQEGVIKTDKSTDVSQYNFRSNIDVQATDRIDVALNLAGRLEERQWYGASSFDVLQNTAKANPLDPVYRDGKLFAGIGRFNPLAFVQEEGGYNRQNNTLFNGTLSVKYKIPQIEGLSVSAQGSVDFTQNFHKNYLRPLTQYVEDPTDNTKLIEQKIGSPVFKVEEAYWRQRLLTFTSRIEYANTFKNHSISAFIGYEESRTKNNFSNLSRQDGLLELTDQLSSGDTENQTTAGGAGTTARQSYLGRLSYDFSKKYFTEFQFRYDGSFNFAKDKRFGFFPTVSVGWRVSEENFLKDSQTISNLKLKGTWGQLGNDRVPAFQFLNRFGSNGTFPIGGGNVPVITTIGPDGNPNITWETAESLNLGVEAGFFKNKLTLEVNVFKEDRKDILTPRNATVPNFTGITLPDENLGITKNKGFEAVLGYRTQIGKVNFNIEGNVAYSKNKLVFQDAVEPAEEYQNLEGRPIGTRLIYNAIGIYRTQTDLDNNPGLPGASLGDLIYADTNEDGTIDANDRIAFEKTAIPEMQFGLNLGAQYKGFDLSVLLQGQTNANIETRAIFSGASNSQNVPEYFLNNAYTTLTPNASLPRIGDTQSQLNGYDGAANASTFWQRDASFVRLKNVELAYNLPSDVMSKIGVNSLRIYISGTNLITLDKLKKDGLADPEQVSELGWAIPHQKLFNLGLNVTF